MYTNITAFRLDRDNIDTRIINHGVDTVTIATELSGKIDRSIRIIASINGQTLPKRSTFGEKSSLWWLKKKRRKTPHEAYTMKLHKVGGANNRVGVSLLERGMQKRKERERKKEKPGIHYSRLIAHESIGDDRGPVKRNNHARSFGGSQVLCSEGLTLTDLTFRSLRTSVSSAKTKTSLPH